MTVGYSELQTAYCPHDKLISVGETVANEMVLFSAVLYERWFVGTLVTVVGIIGEIG